MAGVKVTINPPEEIPQEEGYKLLAYYNAKDVQLKKVRRSENDQFIVDRMEELQGWLRIPQGKKEERDTESSILEIDDMPIIEDKSKILESQVLAFTEKNPSLGQVRVSSELAKLNIHVGHMTVRNIWIKHDIATKEKRLAKYGS